MHTSCRTRWITLIAAFVTFLALPASSRADSVARSKTPILVVAEEVIDELFDTLWKKPAAVLQRDIRTRNGLLGLGAYRPPGMIVGGLKAPPIHLLPRAGLGNSLNVDPVTGRSYFQ